jgi:hypothetical protein
MGLLSMVEAGLAVAPLARCAVPAHFSLLGQAQGLPEIDRAGSHPGAQQQVEAAALRLPCREDHVGVAALSRTSNRTSRKLHESLMSTSRAPTYDACHYRNR